MKRIIVLLFTALFTFSPAFAFGAFDDAVEDSKNKDSDRKAEKREPSSSSDTSNDFCGAFCEVGCEVCSNVGIDFWLINLEKRYDSYPYASIEPPEREHRFSVDSSFLWLHDLGIGNISSFDSMLFPLVGVFVENQIIHDNINNEGTMGNVRFGLQVPLFQCAPLSILVRGGSSKWYDDVTSHLKEMSVLLGFEIKSYPIQPISLRFKYDCQFFSESVYVSDSELEAGCLINRFEIFAGWRHMSVGNSEANTVSGSWNGINSGLRLHF